MISPTHKKLQKIKAKKMTIGGKRKGEKTGVLLILVSNLHVTDLCVKKSLEMNCVCIALNITII